MEDDGVRHAHGRALASVGETIYRLRSRLGLTLEQVATRAGVRADTVGDVEAAKGDPQFSTVVRIFRALGHETRFTGTRTSDPSQPGYSAATDGSAPRT